MKQVAPSWSSIEFNGNRKISHYWIKNLFEPVGIIAQVKCFILTQLDFDFRQLD